MRRIKIKVKHLIYIIIGTFMTVFFLLPNALFIYAQSVEKNNMEMSKVYYKRYINLFPFGGKRDEALYNLAQNIVSGDSHNARYKVYTTGFRGGGGYVTSTMVDNASGYYREIIDKYENSKFYPKAYDSLINLYTMSGSFGEAQKLIEKGLNSDRQDVAITASKYRMLHYMIGKEYDKAREIGRKYVDEGKADPDICMLMGDINYYDRKLDDALYYYKKAEEKTRWKRYDKQLEKFNMSYYKDAFIEGKTNMINRIIGIKKESSSLHGKVTINGKPVPFIYVYLDDQQEGSGGSIGNEDSKISAITDFDGNYTIPLLPEGDYIMGVGIPTIYLDNTSIQTPSEGYFHLKKGENKELNFTFTPPMKLISQKGTVVPIDGKVDVEWEKVEGAKYYLVRLIQFEEPGNLEGNNHSYCAFSPGDKIFDTSYTIDINKVNMATHGFMMNDKGELNPQAYLGVFYPGSQVPFYVEAFDKDGGLIKSTVPMKVNFKDITIISIPDDKLTASDRLVLDRKPEEAAESYEKDIEKNPDDIHAMRVLTKIYSLGTIRKYEPEAGEQIEGRNKERAIEHCNRLYQITGDVDHLKQQFKRHFIDIPEDCSRVLEGYLKIPGEFLEAEDYAIIGSMNMQLKRYKEADKWFEKVYEAYRDTNYYDLAPVILRLYLKDYVSGLRFLDILDLKLYMVDRDELIEDINRLKNMDKNTEEYKKFEDALEIIMISKGNMQYRKQYSDIYNTINHPVLSRLLKGIGNYYHVFDRYDN